MIREQTTPALLNGLRERGRELSSSPLPTGFPLRPRDVVDGLSPYGPTVRRGGKERLPERIKKMKNRDLGGRRFSLLLLSSSSNDERRRTNDDERRTTNDERRQSAPSLFHSPAGGGETSLLDVSPGGAAPSKERGRRRPTPRRRSAASRGNPGCKEKEEGSASTVGVRPLQKCRYATSSISGAFGWPPSTPIPAQPTTIPLKDYIVYIGNLRTPAILP